MARRSERSTHRVGTALAEQCVDAGSLTDLMFALGEAGCVPGGSDVQVGGGVELAVSFSEAGCDCAPTRRRLRDIAERVETGPAQWAVPAGLAVVAAAAAVIRYITI